LKQPFDVLFSPKTQIASFGFKQMPVSIKKISEIRRRPPKGAVGMAKVSFSFLVVPAGCWCSARFPSDFSSSWESNY
jgi:hypothetical protein